MRAVVLRGHGGPEVVRIEDVPAPGAGAGEVVVAVRAAALNHLDLWIRKGRPGLELNFPHVIGSDAAGVVAEVRPGVVGIRAADEVVIHPGLTCGRCEACLRGEGSECASFGIIGMTRPGTFAERVAVPAANVRPKPAHLSFEQAAALSLAHLTAYRMLFTRARLAPGETILIHGIGGGVALAALQLATRAGARAIVTSSSEAKRTRARGLGAAEVIDYRNEDVAKRVAEWTGGRGVDVAFDTVGAAAWPLDIACVRKGGRIVICGVTTGAEAPANLQAIYWRQLTILGSTLGSHEEFRRMLEMVYATRIEPVVDRVEPLDRAGDAMAWMEKGEQFGKIVLRV